MKDAAFVLCAPAKMYHGKVPKNITRIPCSGCCEMLLAAPSSVRLIGQGVKALCPCCAKKASGPRMPVMTEQAIEEMKQYRKDDIEKN